MGGAGWFIRDGGGGSDRPSHRAGPGLGLGPAGKLKRNKKLTVDRPAGPEAGEEFQGRSDGQAEAGGGPPPSLSPEQDPECVTFVPGTFLQTSAAEAGRGRPGTVRDGQTPPPFVKFQTEVGMCHFVSLSRGTKRGSEMTRNHQKSNVLYGFW